MDKRQLLFIFLTAFLFSIIVNELNLQYIRYVNPQNEEINAKSLVYGRTIYSIDNEWYLPQIKNALAGYGYTLDPDNLNMIVRRTPGYPLFYGLHYLILGERWAHRIIPFTQSLLFAISAAALALVSYYLFYNKKTALLTGFLYALSPFIVGYTYYTITEAIYPAFVVFSLFFLVKALRFSKSRNWFLAGATASFMVLIRPLCGVFVLAVGILIIYCFFKDGKAYFRQALIFAGGFILINLPWTLHNFLKVQEFVPLEKFYNEDPMVYGKGQIYFRKWWASWGNPEAEIVANKVVSDALNDTTVHIEAFIEKLPSEAVQGYDKKDVRAAMMSLRNCFQYKIKEGIGVRAYLRGEKVPDCEENVKDRFETLRTSFRNEAPVRYYFITPLKFAKEFFLQSYSSMYASLNPKDGFAFWQIIVKGVMYGLNILLHLSLVLFLIFYKNVNINLLFGVFYFVTLLFLCLALRYIEARYMLQTYPVLYISFGYVLFYLSGKVKSSTSQ